MKKDVSHEHFERFLKDNADELQMRPTAALWNRIEGRLNRRRRWVFLTSAAFLLTASVFGYFIIDNAKHPADPFAAVQTTPLKQPSALTTTNAGAPTKTKRPTAKPAQNTSGQQKVLTAAAIELFQKPMLAATGTPENITGPSAGTTFTPNPVDEYQPVAGEAKPTTAPAQKQTARLPLTIESVVNTYQPKLKKHRSEFQLFFTPTISYRRLTENKSYLRMVPQNMVTYNIAALYDVNNMVTHKPDLGLELGFALKYRITPHLKLRTGMQFNITRYSIKAFTYVPERTTIALNNRNRGVDSLATMSSYRNFSGGRADWLQNFYFQVSTPVGVEVALSPGKKTHFGIATTIQPTYVLGDRAYLISSDYKNYSQVPWLIRRWNVNTSLETFVSYSTGKLRWQVGPQVRYQLLSSFVAQYPVKENLFDFGMKLGVSMDKK